GVERRRRDRVVQARRGARRRRDPPHLRRPRRHEPRLRRRAAACRVERAEDRRDRVRRRGKARRLPRGHRVGGRARGAGRVAVPRPQAVDRRGEGLPGKRRDSGAAMNVKFTDGLIPAIVRDARSGEVLMLAYMSEESLRRTMESGETWFWSRSRNELWHKGETSGNTQRVVHIAPDCDRDAPVVSVIPSG